MPRFHFKPTALSLLTLSLAACSTLQAPNTATPDLPTVAQNDLDSTADQQARALLAQMTLDEKIQLVHGAGIGSSPLGGGGFIKGIPRLGIPDLNMADSAAGVNAGIQGAVAYPAPIAVASSWDPNLTFELGTQIGKELRVRGFAVGLGSGANMARDPRYGRNWEYLGEDPFLAGTFLTQRTLAVQAQYVISNPKHLVGNEQETNRFYSNSVIDERTLREIYLLPFEMTVKTAQPGTIMCAYNLVNGSKACESKTLLTDILKTEWGFKGVVMSDWIFALTDTVRGANAGLDEEQPGSQDDYQSVYGLPPSNFNQKLKAAVLNGSVPMSRLDDMVFRKLRTLYRYGIMQNPPTVSGSIDRATGEALAQKAASQSMVLLKNAVPTGSSSSVLPISKTIQKIVVIGGHADVGVMNGGGSAAVIPQDGNPVPCLTPGAAFDPGGVFSKCAPYYKSSPLQAIKAKVPGATVTYYSGEDSAAAANAAATADLAIVFATQFTSENMDLTDLNLPNNTTDPANQAYDQNNLIAAVSAKQKRTVVVLENGGPVKMPWISSVPGILEAWYPGVRGGQAIADVLFGDVNPSGKLPVTFPKTEADLPQKAISSASDVPYTEGLKMGYRWYDSQNITPLFPFGHGLSYTTFSTSSLITTKEANGDVTVRFTLKNTGVRAGAEVAQVYAALPASAGEPFKRLVGWQKVNLQPGQATQVTVTVKKERLNIWDASNHRWVTPAGTYTFFVGNSSRDPGMVSAARSY
ncbi:beta-glucosidase family protein [Deinococcus roseus]|uniref:Glycosyl hydrolase n=1 Tax=Deinococcus roseus TaxID=392414 RepID=A0ABQ2DL05_9DEIO|nr:glycoside hydrolase family 3 C-terminal domain-containing protein [Deinococcus roseus]GGJ58425.1 glycosyl hydrolase [Deinococcus roseus]